MQGKGLAAMLLQVPGSIPIAEFCPALRNRQLALGVHL